MTTGSGSMPSSLSCTACSFITRLGVALGHELNLSKGAQRLGSVTFPDKCPALEWPA
ncbi:uncharacterized protein BDZ83DRAFT_644062 [Colletotrichum acutatum]|uniref:Uncharacterized protein n=1 Tax=Glomerella acutata TaxID=27357 RepID=A0AAD8U9E7_GLOAC|nr:uncharacterized protein BDZ83DRAFT_644062 [Colletotrichum acutatum]KAK1705636.1 hypothetical protein BDZ83DRAFT_644062 [Colletotrichum acutatum]